ncbi:MAG: PUR family DNA/RNA-binding protein [Bacteroidales bacterium]|nr:PUR family DNA/RNA-binding protein [Bacteroidales bacterium]MCF8333427.1 PUR family DNA/RNA-binding protein [Bacteroidales bacterium]
MAENNARRRDEIFSRAVRAGKRTYFFDVKSTRKGEYYLTITESKRKFNNDQGKFYYEKFKLFLYKEDFDKFKDALGETIKYINDNQQVTSGDDQEAQQSELQSGQPEETQQVRETQEAPTQEKVNEEEGNEAEKDPFNTSFHSNIDFEDLGSEPNKKLEEEKRFNK